MAWNTWTATQQHGHTCPLHSMNITATRQGLGLPAKGPRAGRLDEGSETSAEGPSDVLNQRTRVAVGGYQTTVGKA